MACWFEALKRPIDVGERDQRLIGLGGTGWVDWKTLVYWRMKQDGWCPAELSMMSGRLNAMSIFFMSHVQRPNLTKKHSTIRPLYFFFGSHDSS
jgi:hypothetical protein